MNTIYVGKDLLKSSEALLESFGMTIEYYEGSDDVYKEVKHHIDLAMVEIDGVLYHSKEVEAPKEFTDSVALEGPGKTYPEVAKFNVCSVGNYVIGNTKTMHGAILSDVSDRLIDVKQGYSKCSTYIVDDESIITSDEGIHRAVQGKIDCLLIQPGHVKLEGMEYGFIGGTGGRINSQFCFFNGDITAHPDYEKIKTFIQERRKIILFTDEPLTDMGSFIVK